jgi:hypothetical protein
LPEIVVEIKVVEIKANAAYGHLPVFGTRKLEKSSPNPRGRGKVEVVSPGCGSLSA